MRNKESKSLKHVVITGGSDGLGKVTAAQLIAAGYKVTILSKDSAKTQEAAAELKCECIVVDVTDSNALQKALAEVRVDILINNAGVWLQGSFDENNPDDLKKTMDVNALGTMLAINAVLPGMKRRKSGRIINVISQAGLYGKAERVAYNASKWAVTGLTKSLQQELKPYGISVTGFYPGALNNESLFDKAGNHRDMSKALELTIAAEAIKYVCDLPANVNVPEFGIESLEY